MASTPPVSPHAAPMGTLVESSKYPYFTFNPAGLDSPRTPFRVSKLGVPPSLGASFSTATPPFTSPFVSAAGSSVDTSSADDLDTSRRSVATSEFISLAEDKIIAIQSTLRAGPIVKRQVNAETGDSRTVVIDETGRASTYSQETVSSALLGAFRAAHVLPDGDRLANSAVKKFSVTRDKHGRIEAIGDESISTFFDEAVMRKWIASLRKCHLKGFDQEIRFRLSSIWTEYSEIKEKHEDYLENADFILFGLDKETATLKDLEKAFHRLARLMHPDKNGGSAEAKTRFQEMKERYEALKRKIMAKGGKASGEDEQKELMDEGQEYDDSEIDDSGSRSQEDSPEPEQEPDLDRDAIEARIWKLLDTAKTMQRQMKKWKEQLDNSSQAK